MTKVFVAGGTGAIGARLVPLLAERGYDVVAMTRTPDKAGALLEAGATPVVADGLDRDAVMAAVRRAEPEIVINEMTGLAGASNFKRFDREFAVTNRLRTEGNDHLIEAARAVGARRFIAQSFGNWNYERSGSAVKSEDDPLDPHPPGNQRESLAAIRYLERAVVEAPGIEGVVLRYGNLYGPGTNISQRGELAATVRKRGFPIVGDGAGTWSFIHVDDAAVATITAIERGAPGIYNVADDEPVALSEWLPELALALDAPAPRHVPRWLGRLAAGEVGVSMMTRIRGASNAKAKRELRWTPRYASYREGFHRGLGDLPLPAIGSL